MISALKYVTNLILPYQSITLLFWMSGWWTGSGMKHAHSNCCIPLSRESATLHFFDYVPSRDPNKSYMVSTWIYGDCILDIFLCSNSQNFVDIFHSFGKQEKNEGLVLSCTFWFFIDSLLQWKVWRQITSSGYKWVKSTNNNIHYGIFIMLQWLERKQCIVGCQKSECMYLQKFFYQMAMLQIDKTVWLTKCRLSTSTHGPLSWNQFQAIATLSQIHEHPSLNTMATPCRWISSRNLYNSRRWYTPHWCCWRCCFLPVLVIVIWK